MPDRVTATEIDESPRPAEVPRACVLRLAAAKAGAAEAGAGDVVLAADTLVAAGRRILGKPGDERAALAALQFLSGRRHRVITAVAVRRDDRVRTRAVETAVRFKRLSEHDIADYLASGEWRGKAGAYAIQGRAGVFVPWIRGSYSNVVGLPLTETLNLLDAVGYRRPAP